MYSPLQGVLAKSAEPQQPLQSVSSCECWQKEMNSDMAAGLGSSPVSWCETQAISPFPQDSTQVLAGSKTRTRGCAGSSRSSSFTACTWQSMRHLPAQPMSHRNQRSPALCRWSSALPAHHLLLSDGTEVRRAVSLLECRVPPPSAWPHLPQRQSGASTVTFHSE